jgi:NTP pyrophosphatase (non-canonical NTP hydrolase)
MVLKVETQDSIEDWADSIFGLDPGPEIILPRVNSEMAELLRSVSSRKRSAELANSIVMECADVVIILCRVAKHDGIDLTRQFNDDHVGRVGDDARQIAAQANPSLARAMVTTGLARSVHVKFCVLHLAELCAFMASHLGTAVSEKMAINRKRKWHLHGDGTGQHIA